MSRYEAGETLASIARTYDCSPPAISYIVSRSRDRHQTAEAAQATEPQLIKVHAGEPVAAMAPPPPQSAPPPAPAYAERNAGLAATLSRGLPQRPNGAAAPAPQPPAGPGNGDARRTLHLSLGGNGTNGSGMNDAGSNGIGHGGHGNGGDAEPPHFGNGFRPSQAQPPQERLEPRPPPQPQARYGFPQGERGFAQPQPRIDPDAARRSRDPGTFIDHELRARVDGDIAAFLAAFDAALAGDTLESRAGLREATDRLLRAGARTRIELERLEARVPLSSRDVDRGVEPNWRHR